MSVQVHSPFFAFLTFWLFGTSWLAAATLSAFLFRLWLANSSGGGTSSSSNGSAAEDEEELFCFLFLETLFSFFQSFCIIMSRKSENLSSNICVTSARVTPPDNEGGCACGAAAEQAAPVEQEVQISHVALFVALAAPWPRAQAADRPKSRPPPRDSLP